MSEEPRFDTVAKAAATPDLPQPYTELGMKDEEYARVREILGRRPTSAELAIYSVMWSEHCSYKSSKVHLRQFGEKAPDTDVLLVGIGENAGVVREVLSWTQSGGVLQLLAPPPFVPAAGDVLRIQPGCDKSRDTCKLKFNNALNHRGEHLIPKSSSVVETPA